MFRLDRCLIYYSFNLIGHASSFSLIPMESTRKSYLFKSEHGNLKQSKKTLDLKKPINTDGNAFWFWRVDNSSQLTRSRMYELNLGDGSEIISCIWFIVRAAIHSSPSTSPIKDKDRREVSLEAFGDTNRTKIFDYGIGELMIDDDDDMDFDDGDVEFDDAEILNLPEILWKSAWGSEQKRLILWFHNDSLDLHSFNIIVSTDLYYLHFFRFFHVQWSTESILIIVRPTYIIEAPWTERNGVLDWVINEPLERLNKAIFLAIAAVSLTGGGWGSLTFNWID